MVTPGRGALAAVAALALACASVAACTGGDGPMMPPPECPDLPPIGCELMDLGYAFPVAMSGSTHGALDSFGGAMCGRGGDAVSDAAFRWTAPAAGRYTVSTEGSGFDTILYVRDGSCVGREIACNDDLARGVTQSKVELELAQCQTVTIVVDGFAVAEVGGFELTITGRESACDDGVDNDGDGAADCEDTDCFSAACSMDGTWPVDWAGLEWEMLDEVNRHRMEGATCRGMPMPPAPPLEMDEVVRLAARLHSKDMADLDYFAHDSLDGRSFADRLRMVGYGGSNPWGENIAQGYPTAREATDAFMGSSEGHCENIMNPNYHVIGIGYATDGTPFGQRWTQDFGGSH